MSSNRPLLVTLIAAIGMACADDGASAQARSAITELPVLEGSTECQWAEGADVLCRRATGASATAALQYPLLLRAQGWVDTGLGSTPDSTHSNAIFFERAIDRRCSERVSIELAPAAPGSEDTMPVVLIRTNYEPVCGSERRAP